MFLLLSWLAAASISTRSFPPRMRSRFFFSPLPVCNWACFSSRSLRRSSLVFFLGRVLWFSESRSILPTTLRLGTAFCSVFNLYTSGAFAASSADICVSEIVGVAGVSGFTSAASFGSGLTSTSGSGLTSAAFTSSFLGSSFTGLSAAVTFGAGFSSLTGSAAGLAAGFLPLRLSRSILPKGVKVWRDSSFVSAFTGSLGFGLSFFSFLGKIILACFFTSLSPLNSLTSA